MLSRFGYLHHELVLRGIIQSLNFRYRLVIVWRMMSASEEPFYVSPRSSRSIWQEYRIYPDRLELQCWVAFHTLVIPAEEILEIEVRPPIVFADLFRGKSFLYSFPLKIDGADGHRHVAIKRKCGFIKHIRFTPDDPDRFVEVCRLIMR